MLHYDAYSDDKPLVEAVKAFGGGWAEQTLRRAGLVVGSAKVQQLARQANRNLPELRTHDRFGNRIDVVEYHPAYHELSASYTKRKRILSPGPTGTKLVHTWHAPH